MKIFRLKDPNYPSNSDVTKDLFVITNDEPMTNYVGGKFVIYANHDGGNPQLTDGLFRGMGSYFEILASNSKKLTPNHLIPRSDLVLIRNTCELGCSYASFMLEMLRVEIPCPDNIDGCEVYHCKEVVKSYNNEVKIVWKSVAIPNETPKLPLIEQMAEDYVLDMKTKAKECLVDGNKLWATHWEAAAWIAKINFIDGAEAVSLAFLEFCMKNYFKDLTGTWYKLMRSDADKSGYTTTQLFEIFKNQL